MLEVPDWGLVSWSWFWYGHWSLIRQCSNLLLSNLILKVQRTSLSFKSQIEDLEDAGIYWLVFGILILIWIYSLLFDAPMFKFFSLCLNFEGANNIYVLLVLIWGFGGLWRFLTGVWHCDQDLDMTHSCSKFALSILILKVQITFMAVKSSFGALEDAWSSWLRFGVFILICIWSLVFDTHMFQMLALYLDFEGANNMHVL